MKKISIAIIDDHVMLRKGLAAILDREPDLQVVLEADNGLHFTELVQSGKTVPDLILLDVHMPEMDGHATALWIGENLPLSRVLILSMNDTEELVIKMLRAGARGYVLKDGNPHELIRAIHDVMGHGYHLSKAVTNELLFSMTKWKPVPEGGSTKLSEREREFIKLCCSDLTYKEIADKMFVSVRTVDGYRDALFEKLDQKSRVGLVIYAIKNKLFEV